MKYYLLNLTETIYTIQQKINSLDYEEKEQIENIKKKFESERIKYINALNVNMELNEACLECRGRGTISFLDAAGQRDSETCKACNGNGRKRK